MKIDPEKIYVAVMSFAGSDIAVQAGMRLRGDNPIVARCAAFFLPDGADQDTINKARTKLIQEAEADVPVPELQRAPIAKAIPPDDQALCIASVYLSPGVAANTGNIVSKRSKLVQRFPEAFVSVKPPELKAEDAIIALEDLTTFGDGGAVVRKVRKHQWLHKRDPLFQIHPAMFTLPALEPAGRS